MYIVLSTYHLIVLRLLFLDFSHCLWCTDCSLLLSPSISCCQLSMACHLCYFPQMTFTNGLVSSPTLYITPSRLYIVYLSWTAFRLLKPSLHIFLPFTMACGHRHYPFLIMLFSQTPCALTFFLTCSYLVICLVLPVYVDSSFILFFTVWCSILRLYLLCIFLSIAVNIPLSLVPAILRRPFMLFVCIFFSKILLPCTS